MATYGLPNGNGGLTILGAVACGGAADAGDLVYGAGAPQLELSEREQSAVKRLEGAGWQVLRDRKPDWRAVRERRGQALRAGLLARRPSGGVVLLPNHVLLKADPAAHERLAKFKPRRLPFGEDLYEVTLEVGDQDLEQMLETEVDKIANTPGVAFAHAAAVYAAQATTFEDLPQAPTSYPYGQWQWEKIELQRAWDEGGKRGEGTRVAVIDMGFHVEDDQLKDNIDPGDAIGIDADGNRLAPGVALPKSWHGTFCAGLVGAADDTKFVIGAAPKARLRLLALQEVSSLTLARALHLAVDDLEGRPGADVISCSIAPEEGSFLKDASLRNAIDYAHANGRKGKGRGTLVVWAVANDDLPIPATSVESYEPLLCVGRCDQADQPYGAHGQGLDLIAPGVAVSGIVWDGETRRALAQSGASFAAPCVAGVAALALAANDKLTADQLAKVLCERSSDPEVDPKSWDDKRGWGRLNARRAVLAAK